MPITVFRSGSASNPATTTGVDTTGADLLVLHTTSVYYAETVSDSYGNVWTHLTPRAAGSGAGYYSQLHYCVPPPAKTGPGHTFATTGGAAAIAFLAASGADPMPFEAEAGDTPAGLVTSAQPGSLTPAENGALCVAGLAYNEPGSAAAAGSGYTTVNQNPVSGVSWPTALAYLEQAVAAAVNPTFAWTGSVGAAATAAVFKPAVTVVVPQWVPTRRRRPRFEAESVVRAVSRRGGVRRPAWNVALHVPTAATSFLFTGPSSAVLHAESEEFTVLILGGDYAGTMNLNTTGAGTFSPPVLVFTPGMSAASFTYTPTTMAASPHFISVTAGPPLGPGAGDVPVDVEPPPAPLRNRSAIMPEEVIVRFIGKGCGLGPGDPAPHYYIKRIQIADIIDDASAEGHVGSKVFFDWAAALYEVSTANPINKDYLDRMAEQIAIDFYVWTGTSFDQTFSGVLDLDVSALYDGYEIQYYDDQCYTRLMTEPWAGGVETLMHWAPLNQYGYYGAFPCDLRESDNPFVYYLAPPAICTNGHITVNVMKLHLFDGRLYTSFVRKDTI